MRVQLFEALRQLLHEDRQDQPETPIQQFWSILDLIRDLEANASDQRRIPPMDVLSIGSMAIFANLHRVSGFCSTVLFLMDREIIFPPPQGDHECPART